MSIHSDAIHNRAKGARAEALACATKLKYVLLEWMAKDCPASVSEYAAATVKMLAQVEDSCPSMLLTDHFPGKKELDACISSLYGDCKALRDAYYGFDRARAAAIALTNAAQTVEHRATLP
jgi:hypothetical protein